MLQERHNSGHAGTSGSGQERTSTPSRNRNIHLMAVNNIEQQRKLLVLANRLSAAAYAINASRLKTVRRPFAHYRRSERSRFGIRPGLRKA
jgi:hypothetical protein